MTRPTMSPRSISGFPLKRWRIPSVQDQVFPSVPPNICEWRCSIRRSWTPWPRDLAAFLLLALLHDRSLALELLSLLRVELTTQGNEEGETKAGARRRCCTPTTCKICERRARFVGGLPQRGHRRLPLPRQESLVGLPRLQPGSRGGEASRNRRWEYINAGVYVFVAALLVGSFLAQLWPWGCPRKLASRWPSSGCWAWWA